MASHPPQIDPECRLALAYMDAGSRERVGSLFALDAALGTIVASGGQPMTTQIRLAWWRDALTRLDEVPPPAEPLLQDVAAHVLPAGIAGRELGVMAGAWEHLIADGALSREDMEAFARLRGGQFFRLAARALGGDSSPWIERAGEAWALADLARRSRDAGEAAAVLVSVRERAAVIRGWPAMLRPLGMLAMLAVRDAERGPDRLEPIGSPRRMMAMLRYRLIGR